MSIPLAFFGGIGATEALIVGGVILLLFGNRLPSVMRNMGRGIVEFKKGVQGIEDETDEEEDERPAKRKLERGEKQESQNA